MLNLCVWCLYGVFIYFLFFNKGCPAVVCDGRHGGDKKECITYSPIGDSKKWVLQGTLMVINPPNIPEIPFRSSQLAEFFLNPEMLSRTSSKIKINALLLDEKVHSLLKAVFDKKLEWTLIGHYKPGSKGFFFFKLIFWILCLRYHLPDNSCVYFNIFEIPRWNLLYFLLVLVDNLAYIISDESALDRAEKIRLTVLKPTKPMSSLNLENVSEFLFNVTEVSRLANSVVVVS